MTRACAARDGATSTSPEGPGSRPGPAAAPKPTLRQDDARSGSSGRQRDPGIAMWELVQAAGQLRRQLAEAGAPMPEDVRGDLHALLRLTNGMLQDEQARAKAAAR